MELLPHEPTEGVTLDLTPKDENINNEEIQMSPPDIAAAEDCSGNTNNGKYTSSKEVQPRMVVRAPIQKTARSVIIAAVAITLNITLVLVLTAVGVGQAGESTAHDVVMTEPESKCNFLNNIGRERNHQ